MSWSSIDPRMEEHEVAQTGWLNRWLLKHPIRGPVICFIIAGIFIGLSFIPGMGTLVFLAIIPFLTGLFLLIRALLHRAFGPYSTRNHEPMDEPSEEYMEVDEQARQRAVEKWRRRGNPGG